MNDARQSPDSQAAAFRKKTWLYLYLPFAIAGVVVVAYALLWLQGAKTMRRSVEDWAQDQRDNGLAVSYGEIKTGGFPFFLRATVSEADIAEPGRWRWKTERLAIDALPYDLHRLIFSPLGDQRFESPDLGIWRAQAENIRASIAADRERGWKFSLDVSNGAARREDRSGQVTVTRLLVDVAPNSVDPAITETSLHAADLDLKDGERALSLSIVDAALGFAQAVAPGEALLVRQLGIKAGETRLAATGVVGLDADGYPAGAVDAEIENPAGVAKLLADAGVLTQSESDTVGAGLALMALATGGKLAAPIVFQHGMVKIGKFKLGNLPRID